MTMCISADSHVTEPPDTYIDRIDPEFRDRAPRMHHDDTLGDVMLIDNGKSLVPFWLVAAAGRPTEEVRLDSGKRFEELHRGGWDPVARLDDQDTDGVRAEVIYPSVGMLLCNHPDVDYQHACFDAYNQWIAEFCATAPDRLIGIGQTALRTPAEGHPRPRGDQGARAARRDAARHPAERRLRRPDVRRVLGRGRRPRAAAVVPHPHVGQRHAVRAEHPRPEAEQLHVDHARQPGHHRHARSSARCSNAIPICGSCASRPTPGGRRTGCTAPTTPTTATATG